MRNDPPRFTELDADYEMLQELGRGGTAVVYLARERELDRLVAIKVMRSAYIEDEEAAARLVREARTVGALQHPNIVMLYGTRRLRDGSLALIMQYVQGHTLRAEIQAGGALPLHRVEQVLADVGAALAHAHRRRIVHRDIKPENVYIDEGGTARLSDFGIARPWGADSNLTLPGAAIGTPAYMSPEQIDGGQLDGRSDLYSLGLVGYEMLTGRRPWAGESLFSVIYKQKHEALPALAMQRPGVPATLVEAIEGALRKEPDERWPDAESFLSALRGGAPAPERAAESAAGADVAFASDGMVRPIGEVTEPDPDALTIKYRRADADQSEVSLPGPVARRPAEPDVPVAEDDEVLPDESAEPVPPLFSLLTVNELEEEKAPQEEAEEEPGRRFILRRHPKAAVAAVIALFVTGIAVLTGVSLWGSAGSDGMGPTSAAALPPEPQPQAQPAAGAPVPPVAVVVGSVAATAGGRQEGVVGDTLPERLVVRVTDPQGRPLPDLGVRFVVIEGESAVTPATATTGPDGSAEARWVPTTSGSHVVEAQVVDADVAGARFEARVEPRSPARLARVSAERLRGTAGAPASAPLVVRVEDDRGRPLAGVPVQFAVRRGEGRVDREVVTGRNGTASARWVLGAGEEQVVVAAVPDLEGDSVVFRATGQPGPLAVRRGIEAGGTHTCVLAGGGGAACWGGNDSGQLGDGAGARRSGPATVRAPEAFAYLSAGVSHTCAVSVSGAAYCWGANASGQLGDGTTTGRSEPVRVGTEQRFASVVAGMSHSCGLSATGQLFCWGKNDQGQLGDGTRTSRTTPVRAGGSRTFRSVALGWSHTCAVARDGGAWCWGRNTFGELGDGSTGDRAEPVAVAGGHRFSALAAGSAHTCGLRTDGDVLCWGQSTHGQLGTGTENSRVPVQVQAGVAFTAVTAGGVHTCALARDGAAWCWGRNNYGQVGDGTIADRPHPIVVETSRRFTRISASGAHTCALATSGQEFCWGFNLEGQLGDGSRTNQTRPVLVRRGE